MQVQNVRISFPNIFQASAFAEGQTKKFSATFIMDEDHPQMEALKEAIEQTAIAKWDKKIPSSLKRPLRDGEEKDLDGFGEGTFFFNASNTKRPVLKDKDLSALVEDDGKPYAGCYVNAIIELWGQDNQYGKRVNANVLAVQFAKDGEPFGDGVSASIDDFDDVEPVADMDDFM